MEEWEGQATDDGLLQALDSSWRKVASTHNLQALIVDQPTPSMAPQDWPRSLAMGILLVAVASAMLALELFALASKLLPPLSNGLAAAIQGDWYYCFLVPLAMPITIIAVGANWFCLKLFKHNS